MTAALCGGSVSARCTRGQDLFILSLFPFASFPVRIYLLPTLHNHFFKTFMEVICSLPDPLSFSDVELAEVEREKD